VNLPNTSSITVTVRQASEPIEGWTTVTTDSPLLTTDTDGKEHLDRRQKLLQQPGGSGTPTEPFVEMIAA
jgi:hypothetical protein